MKTSVSIPDELWDCVKGAGDGPSAVVQQALTLLCDQRLDPMAHAPSAETKDRLRPALVAAAERFRSELGEMLDSGYSLGVELAQWLDFFTLTSLPSNVDELADRINLPYRGNFFELSHPHRSEEWQNLWEELDVADPLSHRMSFWWQLDAALRVHIEEAADAADLTDRRDGSITGIRSPVDGLVYDWWQSDYYHEQECDPPSSVEGVGISLLQQAGLPEAFAHGIAGGLLDVRGAATASALQHPVVPEPPVETDAPGEGERS